MLSGASGAAVSDGEGVDGPVPQVTTMRAVHVEELRTALTTVYVFAGAPAPVFTDSSLAGIHVKAVHLAEIRDAAVAAP